ncbi:DUF1028 domain-containing protein [Flavobacteriaceae bacterium]|nr:DUF1028 domain-containing protein [Flavobacteriaceae bacterium]MDB4097381.1 DUF1028 domain-containing protein [Flavobacteriaceae bacterium]
MKKIFEDLVENKNFKLILVFGIIKKIVIILLITYPLSSIGQTNPYSDQFAHTYSIVAKDANTGEMAVGVQSHWFSVGTLVSWGKSGVGVVATQSFVNPSYGPNGIELMENGVSAEEALKQLTDQDEGRDFRQAAMLDVNGSVNAFTGEKCIESAGHFVGENFSVQANMMLNDKVIPAMKKAFQDNSNLPLAERIIKVFEAAESVGGDIRGKQSAALIVVGAKKTSNVWEDKKIDLRVDDNSNPIKEIKRLLKVHRAYDHMNKGDLAIEENDMEKALSEYGKAQVLFPENHEMSFWKAIALLNNGKKDAARPILKKVFKENSNWKKLIYRLPKSGLISMKAKELDSFLNNL